MPLIYFNAPENETENLQKTNFENKKNIKED